MPQDRTIALDSIARGLQASSIVRSAHTCPTARKILIAHRARQRCDRRSYRLAPRVDESFGLLNLRPVFGIAKLTFTKP